MIEAEGPVEVLAYALESLVEALTWMGESEKALRPFVQLLRWWDSHPEHFDTGDQNILFWEFGWIVNDLARTPTVPVARVEAILNDMERRFALANRGMERVWASRLEWELLRGGPNLEPTFTTWLTMPIDEEDSCPACHKESHTDYLLEIGDLAGAVAILESAIGAQMSCSRQPAAMLATLAWCYVELDRLDDLEKLIPQVVAELRAATSMSVTKAYGRLFEVYARVGAPTQALGLLDKIVDSLATATPWSRLETLRHLVTGTRALIAWGFGDHEIAAEEVEQKTVTAYRSYVDAQAEELTAAFDNRSGSTIQAERLARARRAEVAKQKIEFQVNQPKAAPEPVVVKTQAPSRTNSTHERAEAAYRAGDHRAAIDLYQMAANEAQADGRLMEAGWCWAEAARNSQEEGQAQAATRDYLQAHALLKASGISLEEISTMFIAWAPTVQAWNYRVFADLALQDYPTPARPGVDDKIEEVLPAVFSAAMIGSPLLRRYVLARAELRDAVARVLATWGDDDEARSGLEMAEESASRFLTLGRTDAAAHAWWLAGKLSLKLGDDNVDSNYTMALQGFLSTGHRNRRYGLEAAGEYASYLTEHGRSDEAQAMLAAWAEKGE
jgi:hypothetical protein